MNVSEEFLKRIFDFLDPNPKQTLALDCSTSHCREGQILTTTLRYRRRRRRCSSHWSRRLANWGTRDTCREGQVGIRRRMKTKHKEESVAFHCVGRRVVQFVEMGSTMVVLLQVLFILINGAMATTDLLLAEDQNPPFLCSDATMDPFHEIRYGQDVIWQIPPDPKAVLFLAHGMSQHPRTFFDSAPNCRQCVGLPEHRKAVLTALARGYAVIMVKSVDTYWLPWCAEWPVVESLDRTIVVNVIREWTKDHSLEHLPLAAFGYSSGGNFTTILTLDLDIKSQVLMCTPGEFELLKHANAMSFPPTLFVPMAIDNGPNGFYTKTLTAKRILDSKGVFTKQMDVWPSPIHPLRFAERIPCLQPDTSRKIYAAYKSEGWLDERDYLTKSPAWNDWEAVLWKHMPLAFCKQSNDLCLAKHVEQELDVAYAFHSFASSALEDVFNWLDDTMFLGNSDPAGLSASR